MSGILHTLRHLLRPGVATSLQIAPALPPVMEAKAALPDCPNCLGAFSYRRVVNMSKETRPGEICVITCHAISCRRCGASTLPLTTAREAELFWRFGLFCDPSGHFHYSAPCG